MNKEDIITEYNAFLKNEKIEAKDFILGAGGACLMYGLRKETDDMDMAIPAAMFDRMKRSGKYKITHFNNPTNGLVDVIVYNAHIDLHRHTEVETTMVDGVCCYSLAQLLYQKQSLNRPKDQEDIKKIKELIRTQYTSSRTKPALKDW